MIGSMAVGEISACFRFPATATSCLRKILKYFTWRELEEVGTSQTEPCTMQWVM